jgi:hypothetical protein
MLEVALNRFMKHCVDALHVSRTPDEVRFVLAAALCALAPEAVPLTLSDVTSVSVVQQSLDELLQEAGNRPELSRAFVRRHYRQWAALLLGSVLRDWISAFTQAQRADLFEPYFLLAPPREALEAIAAALGSDGSVEGIVQGEQVWQRGPAQQRGACCANLLREMQRQHMFKVLFAAEAVLQLPQSSLGASVAASSEALVALVVALPARLANLTRGEGPRSLAPQAFYSSIVEQLMEALQTAQQIQHPNAAPSPLQHLGAMLLARIARLGHFGAVLPSLLAAHTREGGGHCSSAAALLADVPPGAHEPILEVIPSEQARVKWCGVVLKTSLVLGWAGLTDVLYCTLLNAIRIPLSHCSLPLQPPTAASHDSDTHDMCPAALLTMHVDHRCSGDAADGPQPRRVFSYLVRALWDYYKASCHIYASHTMLHRLPARIGADNHRFNSKLNACSKRRLLGVCFPPSPHTKSYDAAAPRYGKPSHATPCHTTPHRSDLLHPTTPPNPLCRTPP